MDREVTKSRRTRRADRIADAASARDIVLQELSAACARLDLRLAEALTAFDALHGGPVADSLRGLVITPLECRDLLHRPGDGSAAARHALAPLWLRTAGSTADRLAGLYALEAFDLDVLLLGLACETDLRYERLFAYLQDDVTRKRPTVDLALRLLCTDPGSRAAARDRFDADAPLLRHGLIELRADPQAVQAPLLSRSICLDGQVLRWLLGAIGLDPRLAETCTVEHDPRARIADLALPAAARQALEVRATRAARTGAPICSWLHGPGGGEGLAAARAVAQATGHRLLRLDATRVPPDAAEATLRLAQREAWFGGALLCVEHTQAWTGEARVIERLAAQLAASPCHAVLLSTQGLPTPLLGIACPIEMPMPEVAQRERCWAAALGGLQRKVEAGIAHALATSYRLMPAQIAAAVADAQLRHDGAATLEQLRGAARAQCGEGLTAVAVKVDARATWDDIVLPADAVAQLRELCSRVEQTERVFGEWGFGRKLGRGRGTAALFSGGSGTGKTMAAEVIANALGLDLYRIDLARVVSKYIGETEKNLDRVFTAAEGANAILLFDEADALFGKRSDVKDAHDRYANIEVSYLLQKMEEYDGIAILASNLADNLDDAFTRRLAFAVHFPMPDEAARLELWRRAWPEAAHVDETLDRHALARELKIAGGSIRNIALGAAFSAAADGGLVDERHVARAVHREFEKAGCASSVPSRLAVHRPS